MVFRSGPAVGNVPSSSSHGARLHYPFCRRVDPGLVLSADRRTLLFHRPPRRLDFLASSLRFPLPSLRRPLVLLGHRQPHRRLVVIPSFGDFLRFHREAKTKKSAHVKSS